MPNSGPRSGALLGALLGVMAAACSAHAPTAPTPPPPPPPAPPAAKVPPGCELNLAGAYHLATPLGWRYVAEDDGTRLTIRPLNTPDDAEPMTMVLDRTPAGFVGHIDGRAATRSGRLCPVQFQAEVVACNPGRIVLRSEDARAVDENCTPGGPVSPATEKTLVRD